MPSIFEVLSTDVFEFEDEATLTKFKMILWRDRASGLTMIDNFNIYETGSWEQRQEHDEVANGVSHSRCCKVLLQ